MAKKLIVAALLLIFIILVISSMRRHSGTCDEIAHHIPVGVILWEKGDLKMDTSQPPLSRYIMAMPVVLFLKPNLPDDKAVWRTEDRSVFGKDFFFKYNQNSQQILFWARLAILLVGIFGAFILFAWAKSLYGLNSALLALFFYCFSVETIAHSGLATTDMASACFILFSLYSFWRFLNKPHWFNLILAAIALGLAQLSKYTAVILYIFYAAFIFTKKEERISLKIFFLFLISFLKIWAGYGFSFSPLLKDALRSPEKIQLIANVLTKIPGISYSRLEYLLFNLPVPLGEHLLGVLGVVRHGQLGHGTYFLGVHSGFGSKFYFLVSFLIKTQLPLLAFFLMGAYSGLKDKLTQKSTGYILSAAAIFFIMASLSNLKLGHRYILLIYPLIFIIAGKSAEWFRVKNLRLWLAVTLAWYALAAILVWPNHLSYFNESIGGPDNGWKYLRDSNIDWGQDLPQLAAYLRKNNLREITLDYFGQDKPEVYGIQWLPLSEAEKFQPQKKVYAISVNLIDGPGWAKNIKPTAKAGKSIFIYDLR